MKSSDQKLWGYQGKLKLMQNLLLKTLIAWLSKDRKIQDINYPTKESQNRRQIWLRITSLVS